LVRTKEVNFGLEEEEEEEKKKKKSHTLLRVWMFRCDFFGFLIKYVVRYSLFKVSFNLG
jgi:hypothetical protein